MAKGRGGGVRKEEGEGEMWEGDGGRGEGSLDGSSWDIDFV